ANRGRRPRAVPPGRRSAAADWVAGGQRTGHRGEDRRLSTTARCCPPPDDKPDRTPKARPSLAPPKKGVMKPGLIQSEFGPLCNSAPRRLPASAAAPASAAT